MSVGNTIKSTVAAMANTAQQNHDEELLASRANPVSVREWDYGIYATQTFY